MKLPLPSAPLSHDIADYPDGIVLPIDKPYRWTSADVVRKVKWRACRHFGKKNLKVGHAGTLDPLATGILLICIGPATKRAEELQASEKEYVAGVSFGATTPSYDLEKDIDTLFPLDGVDEASLREVLKRFTGEQEQVAPLFSAKSVDGVRAYETARRLLKEAKAAGKPYTDPEGILQSSRITIYDMELMDFKGPGETEGRTAPVADSEKSGRINVASAENVRLAESTIRVRCSKGTYIRALARDLGEALGSGAFLNSLRRTENGGYTISEAIGLEEALQLFEF